jgi:hypothetical protein
VKSPTMKMDAEEKELLESVERGEWKSAKGGKRSAPVTPTMRRPHSARIGGWTSGSRARTWKRSRSGRSRRACRIRRRSRAYCISTARQHSARLPVIGQPQHGPPGIPQRVPMKLTGHKTRSFFDRYNVGSDGDLWDASRRLGHTGGHTRPSVSLGRQ